jgi:putative transposase
MTTYRRNFISGGCFFFTVNLADRRLRLLTDHIDILRSAFRDTRQAHPFTIEAMVVLPDHLHAVWTMPEGDADFATRWRLIKTNFSRHLAVSERISESRSAKGGRGIGNGDTGSTPFATKLISPAMSTTLTSTRSNMG